MSEDGTINYVEFIENAGFTLTPDVSRQVAAAPPARLIDFRERYLELARAFQDATEDMSPSKLTESGQTYMGRVFNCPDAEPGEFRPFFHGIHLDMGQTMLGGDSGGAFENLSLASRLRRIKALLLYSHSIVVSDSLFYVNQFFDRLDDIFFEQGRLWLQNYLTIIAALRPLIEKNIIIFYPQYEHGGYGFSWHHRDPYINQHLESWFVKQYSESLKEELIFGSRIVNEMMFYSDRYDATLLLPNQDLLKVLKSIAQFNQSVVRKDKMRDRHIASALANVDLPDLSKLKIADIIAIRRDDTFETWRKMLSAAVEKIDSYQEIDPDTLVLEVQQILTEGEKSIEKETANSKYWALVKGPLGKFGLSSLATLIATQTINPAVGGITAALSFFYSYVAGGKKRKAAKALKNHYAIFTGLNRAE